MQAGRGGHGIVSFHREKFMPKGGPDGGNGGNGGSVYLQAASDLNTLGAFRYQTEFFAENGENGAGGHRTGASGNDLIIRIPRGTTVYEQDGIADDNATNAAMSDLMQETPLLVAKGGRGGRGNATFKSSVNQAPRQYTKGAEGEARTLRLELAVLADVGLLGLPNVGKSSFLNRVSNAHPKIANYPFTTLEPQLGVVSLDITTHFVVSDIPGIIEGASHGVGLGLRFLRHISRCRLILHMLDASGDMEAQHATLMAECAEYAQDGHRYGTALSAIPYVIVIHKADLIAESDHAALIAKWQTRTGRPVFMVSSATGFGIQRINNAIAHHLAHIDDLV